MAKEGEVWRWESAKYCYDFRIAGYDDDGYARGDIVAIHREDPYSPGLSLSLDAQEDGTVRAMITREDEATVIASTGAWIRIGGCLVIECPECQQDFDWDAESSEYLCPRCA